MGLLSSALFPIRAQLRGGNIVAGRMTTAGAANPTKVTPSPGWTVTRTGVGTIVVTLPQAYKEILYADTNLVGGAASTRFAKVVAVSNGSLGSRALATFTIETQSASGTPADLTGVDLMFFVVAAQVAL